MDIEKAIRWLVENPGIIIVLYWLVVPLFKKIFRRKDAPEEETAERTPARTSERHAPTPVEPEFLPELSAPGPEELVSISTFRAKVREQRQRALDLLNQALQNLSDTELASTTIESDIDLLERIETFTEYVQHEADLKNLKTVFSRIISHLNQLEHTLAQRKRALQVVIPAPVVALSPVIVPSVKVRARQRRSPIARQLVRDMRNPDALEEAMALGAVMRRHPLLKSTFGC